MRLSVIDVKGCAFKGDLYLSGMPSNPIKSLEVKAMP